MNELKKIQFVTTNFPFLQGLKTVAIGIFLLFIGKYSPAQQGNLSITLPLLVVTLVLVFLANRYYRKNFGQVQITKKARRMEIIISLIFGILALIAFMIDTSLLLPVSLLGFVFAVGLISDYLRLTMVVKMPFLSIYPWLAVFIILINLFPILGLNIIWENLGFENAVDGVLTLMGLSMIVIGVAGHMFLIRSLPAPLQGQDHVDRI